MLDRKVHWPRGARTFIAPAETTGPRASSGDRTLDAATCGGSNDEGGGPIRPPSSTSTNGHHAERRGNCGGDGVGRCVYASPSLRAGGSIQLAQPTPTILNSRFLRRSGDNCRVLDPTGADSARRGAGGQLRQKWVTPAPVDCFGARARSLLLHPQLRTCHWPSLHSHKRH